jgi:hypothetical protein
MVYLIIKHIDFESKGEDHLNFHKKPKGRNITLVGGIPVNLPEEERRKEPADNETDQIARQILESLENGENT